MFKNNGFKKVVKNIIAAQCKDKKFIIQSTEVGDKVLDPFGGAGALVVACKECSRRGVMIELLEKNCDIARARLEETEADYLQGGLLCQNAD